MRRLLFVTLLIAALPAHAVVINCPDGRICAVDDPAKCACVETCSGSTWVFKGEACPGAGEPEAAPVARIDARSIEEREDDWAREHAAIGEIEAEEMIAARKSDGTALIGATTAVTWILLTVGSALYLLPYLVAARRNHHQRASIAVVSLLAGWTFVVWVGALAWAALPIDAAKCTPDSRPASWRQLIAIVVVWTLGWLFALGGLLTCGLLLAQ